MGNERQNEEGRQSIRKTRKAHTRRTNDIERNDKSNKQDELQWIERPKEEGRESMRKKRKTSTRKKNDLERKRQIKRQRMNFSGSNGGKKQENRACARKGKQAHAERMN